MHRQFTRIAAAVLISVAIHGRSNAVEVEEVELEVQPVAVSQPALQHRLIQTFRDERPGNAAPMYLKAMLMLAEQEADAETWDDVTQWAETPVDELPLDEAREFLKPHVVEDFQPVHRESLMRDKADGGFPAPFLAHVELCSKESDDDILQGSIRFDKLR